MMGRVIYGPYYRTRSSSMAREDVYGETDRHFYFGWADHRGGWLIRRQARATGAFEQATPATNAAHNSFTSAWDNRTTLNYGD